MSGENARRACHFFLERLQLEVSRLSETPFPGHHDGPRKWLSFIRGVIDTAKGYLLRAADPATPARDVKQLIQDAEILAGNAYDWLSHVAGADATAISHQVVAPFQRWANALKIQNTMFFRGEHLSNYEIGTFDAHRWVRLLKHPAKSLVDASAAINWPISRVTVPSQALGMFPHFAVVAHELGHAIQDTIVPDYGPHAADEANFFQRVKARLKSFGTAQQIRSQKIAANWINELKADAVAHAITGPAFFFALAGYLELANSGYGIASTHPPSDLRLTVLLARLSMDTPSFSAIAKRELALDLSLDLVSPNLAKCPPADTLFAELNKAWGNEDDAAICVELVPFCQAIAPSIMAAAVDQVRAVDPSLLYDPAQFDADIRAHLPMLMHLVPPIEHEEAGKVAPVSLASALNLGWAVLLAKIDDMPDIPGTGSAIPPKMERLHELLLKGVELAEARTLWEEQSR